MSFAAMAVSLRTKRFDALSNHQDDIYRITNTTAKELIFDGFYEVFEYKEPPSFEPWLIPYIIFWCIILLSGFLMFKEAIFEAVGMGSKDTIDDDADVKSSIEMGEVNQAVAAEE